jgi:hypothetical protein
MNTETSETKTLADRLFEAVYYLDGRAVAEYASGFFVPKQECHWRSTRYGEELWFEGYDVNGDLVRIKVFDRWNKWRENVTYYYDGLAEAFPDVPIDQLVEVLVFALCKILFFDRLKKELEGYVDFEVRTPALYNKVLFW